MDFISSNRNERITHQVRRDVGNDRSSGDDLKGFIGCNCTTYRTAYVVLVREIKIRKHQYLI